MASRISMKEMYDNRDVVTQIYELKDLSDNTKEVAETASSDAGTAISIANDALSQVAGAQSDATEALKNSETAIADSTEALGKATTAGEAATAALSNAATAQATADTAEEKADAAQETADKGIALVEIQASATQGSLYTKTTKNVEVIQNIPLASQTQTGLMNAQTYQTLNELNSRVSILENKLGTVYVEFSSDSPTQTEITGLFTEKTGRAPISGDTVKDISRGIAYEYDGSTWILYASPTATWSNEGAGIVKGTPASGAAGTLFAETDGTGSVNGWDELNATVTNNYATLDAATKELATGVSNATSAAATAQATANGCFSEYSVSASEEVVSVSMTTAGGTVKGQGLPVASAAQAGTLKASDFSEFKAKQTAITGIEVTLLASGWSDGMQTVVASNVTTDNIVWVAPSPASFDDYGKAGIRATAQGDGTITFTATSVPSSDVVVEVVA